MKLGISKISRGLAATVIAGIVGLSAHSAAMLLEGWSADTTSVAEREGLR